MDPVVLVLMMTDSLPWYTWYLIPRDAQVTLLPEPGSGSIPVPILTPVVCGAPTLPNMPLTVPGRPSRPMGN